VTKGETTKLEIIIAITKERNVDSLSKGHLAEPGDGMNCISELSTSEKGTLTL